jgi:hypothetical protein
MPNGKTCGVPASRGRRFCYHHDPDRRERKPLRAFAASLEPLDSISGLHRLIDQTMRHLLQGKIDGRRARAIIATVHDALAMYEHQLRGVNILCGAAYDRINRTRN